MRELALRTGAGQPPVALLAARTDISAAEVAEIRSAISTRGWHAVPVTLDGQDVLQVTGFKTAQEVTDFLATRGFTSGTAQTTTAPDAPSTTPVEKQPSFLERNSLRLAGVFNLIGDIGFLGNGIITRNPYKIAGGGLYTLGGANLALNGKTNKQRTIQNVSEKMGELISQEALPLPSDSELAAVMRQRKTGALNNLSQTLAQNPAQATLYSYTAGAGAMVLAGAKKYRAGEGAAGLWYGASSFVCKLLALVVPEKSKAKEEEGVKKAPSSNPITRTVDWFKEKPMRIFGIGSLVTDSLLAWETYQEHARKPDAKGWRYTALSAGTYIVADIMAAMSSKNQANAGGMLNADEQRRVEAMAAEVIVAAPEEKRAPLMQKVTKFLAARGEVKGTEREIGVELQQQVERMAHNPWAARIAQADTEVATGRS